MLITIITFIIILGLLVFVHELGHFYTARKFGVKAEEFGFGIPPRIFGIVKVNGKRKFLWGKRKDPSTQLGTGKADTEYENTIFSLNWVPIGGFVRIKGEDGLNNHEPDSFGAQKIWKRASIITSGVIMNFLLAIVIFSITFMSGSPQILEDVDHPSAKIRNEKIQILSIVKDSAASQADLKLNDQLLSIDGQKFKKVENIQKYITKNADQELTVKIKRNQEIIDKKITPKDIEFENGATKKALGIVLAKTGIVSYPPHIAVWKGIVSTLLYIKAIVIILFMIIKDLFSTRELASQISGPIGIAVMTGQIVDMGFVYILNFTAILSINLGVINFFPFPGLDGGRIIGLGIEAIRRQPNNQKIEALIHNIGLAILLAVFALITYQDILKFGGGMLEKIVK